jgi:hypothetical protein
MMINPLRLSHHALCCCFCSYEFGIQSADGVRKVSAVGSQTSSTFTGLPLGNTTLYACASDPLGAQACDTAVITVTPPKCDFKVSDALSGVDVDQMSGTGDPAVVAAGAAGFRSLATFSPPRGCPAVVTGAEAKAAIDAAISAKSGAFVASLATSASKVKQDPQAMQQVRRGIKRRKGLWASLGVQQC